MWWCSCVRRSFSFISGSGIGEDGAALQELVVVGDGRQRAFVGREAGDHSLRVAEAALGETDNPVLDVCLCHNRTLLLSGLADL